MFFVCVDANDDMADMHCQGVMGDHTSRGRMCASKWIWSVLGLCSLRRMIFIVASTLFFLDEIVWLHGKFSMLLVFSLLDHSHALL